MQRVRVEEGVCAQMRVGWDEARSCAFATGHTDAVILDLRVIFAPVVFFFALAVDLSLGVKVVDHKHHDLSDLRIAQCLFIAMEGVQAVDAALFHQIHQFQFALCQFRLDLVDLAQVCNVEIRIGTLQGKQLLAEKERGFEREGVRLGTEQAGNGQANLAVLGIDDVHLAFLAGAFELDAVGCQCEQSDGAHNARSAIGTAIGYGGLFGFKYHDDISFTCICAFAL